MSLEIVRKYIELSNNADIAAISDLYEETATYSSDNVGIHYRKTNIISMQKNFFAKFKKLNWQVPEYTEISTNVFQFKFKLKAVDLADNKIERSGIETVVISDKQLIQHVEVRNL